MARPRDIYDELTLSGLQAPALDEFGNAVGMAGFDPNSTAREQARAAQDLAFQTQAPGAITVAPNSGLGPFQPVVWNQAAWNQTPGQLRRDLKLDDLRTTAAQRKFDLEQSQVNAPLQTRLLEAQINATGAHDRFLQDQDARVLEQTTAFLNTLAHSNTPNPGDAGWDKFMLGLLAKYPRVAETAGGQNLLKKLAATGDSNLSIADIKKSLPEGFDVASVNVGAKGQSVTMKPIQPDKQLEKDAKGYGLTLSQVRRPIGAEIGRRDSEKGFVGDNKGDIVRLEDSDGKKVFLSFKEFERLGGPISPETAAARGSSTAAGATLSTTPVQVQTLADVEKLPSGATFLTPTGVLKRKP